MKRFLFLAAFFFVGTGAASADYVLLKINLNQLNFMPGGQMMGGAGGGVVPPGDGGVVPPGGIVPPGGLQPPPGGFPPGGFPPPGDPNQPKALPSIYPDDPNARWVSALVEVNNLSKIPAVTPFGFLYTCDHRWGKNVWLPYSPVFPMIAGRVPADTFIAEYNVKLKKEQKDKNIEHMLEFARWTLSRGQIRKFHDVMDEAAKINDKHINVTRYQKVKKTLEVPFKLQDPAQRDWIDKFKAEGYKENFSKKGHYTILAPQVGAEDPHTEATIKRRLNLLEDTLETFYFWFAVQKDLAAQPALPKYRLMAIVTGAKDDFVSRHADWGSMPKVADGFTPLRDNVIVMSAKPRVDDPLYAELEGLITPRLAKANEEIPKMWNANIKLTRENLLSGEINTNKESGKAAMFVGAAQTVVLLCKAIEDQAERHTVTNEGVRQLLVASGMFPRNVPVPAWIVEGVSAYLETHANSAYPTIGDRSCVHLVSFKHHRATNKEFKNPHEVLQSVISDGYFQRARQLAADQQGAREDKDPQRAKEAWEVARCSSWAFIYYLSQQRKLDYIFNYGKELDKLPRDMDLSSGVMQGCFAKAFDMAVRENPQMIQDVKLKNMAAHWFEKMEVNLDNGSLQAFLEKERAMQSPETVPVVVGALPKPNPGVNPPPPNPNPVPVASLVGTQWLGTETLAGNAPLTLKFGQGSNVMITTQEGNFAGSFAQAGATVLLQYKTATGIAAYSGTINGNTITGTAVRGQTKWNWSVSMGDGAANPGPLPNPNPPPNPNPGVNPPPNPNPGVNPNPVPNPPPGPGPRPGGTKGPPRPGPGG